MAPLESHAKLSVKTTASLLSKFVPPFLRKRKDNVRRQSGAAGSILGQGVVVQSFKAGSVSIDTTSDASYQTLSLKPLDSTPTADFGYPRNLVDRFEVAEQLGKGGNGVVRVVKDRATGVEFACKSIPKVLKEASAVKAAGHHASIQREVEVLTRLKGSLNIVKLEAVYEDDTYVHIVMEYCRGGELWHRVGEAHYSERTVASYMRAVLRTLAQCHSHHILHRDIKPGNFMLLNKDERSPLKAIDFGLAVPYDPKDLPRSDLGLEGTPWFMAPEVLASQVVPASDVWSAGVMAYQLLTGRFPFDDRKNPVHPSLSAVWKAILLEPLNMDAPWCSSLSKGAKDFVKFLLQRDPTLRPTAKEALKHPWLAGTSAERSVGTQLCISVVQRIQRFSQSSLVKRGVLEIIADELVSNPDAYAASSGPDSPRTCSLHAKPKLVLSGPHSSAMLHVLQQLKLEQQEAVPRSTVANWFQTIGFKLLPSEIDRLLDQVDPSHTGLVQRGQVVACLMDWRVMQQTFSDQWLALSRHTFEAMDENHDGLIGVEDLIASLKRKLPGEEVAAAVKHALQEAGADENSNALDFNEFMRMLRVTSVDSLDLYDDRMSMSRSSLSSKSGHDGTAHTGSYRAMTRSGSQSLTGTVSSETMAQPGSPHQTTTAPPDTAAAPPAPAFNFDKARNGTNGTVQSQDESPPAAAPTPAPGCPPAGSSNHIVPTPNVGLKGGYCDRRMHGSQLYKNVVMAPGGVSGRRAGGPPAPHMGSLYAVQE